jgi:two-component system, LytTR family, response regulator
MSPSLRVLIVDDEPRARSLLRKMIVSDPTIEIVGECPNGYEAIEMTRAMKPDLMFLDVQMPKLSGFDVLAELRKEYLPAVVFVTAFDSYAIRAFEEHALGYLLKPFDAERFLVTLSRARIEIQARQNSQQFNRLAALLDRWKQSDSYLERMAVKQNGRMFLIRTEDIECIESDDNYVHVYCGTACYLLRETLTNLEASLDPKRFIRIHRRALIKLKT